MPGLLTLIGSGEIAPGMVKVHQDLLASIEGAPRPAFIDTPAGFELGLPAIHERYQAFFERSLNQPLTVASYRSAEEPAQSVAQALAAISHSSYIMAGPGSPSYAVRTWRDSPVLAAALARWQAGAQLVFASSAAVAIGSHALPVYEIYKVGERPHWIDGLDLLGPLGYDVAIVPHWDNAEGGTHDTSHCFIGSGRFERLRLQLPPQTVVLGIDEHTACTLDFSRGQVSVHGRGSVTLIHGPEQQIFGNRQTFELTHLSPPQPAGAHPPPDARQVAPGEPLLDLARASSIIGQGNLPGGLRQAAEMAGGDLAVLLHHAAQAAEAVPIPRSHIEPLMQVLIEVRQQLRQEGHYELADRIRDQLAEQGFELRDTPQGTQWELPD
jgi:cyanophycinase-like exopeptidase